MNGASHYPDMSHLYGNTEEKMAELRAPGGLLAVFEDYGRELPPLTKRKECLNMHDGAACFESGNKLPPFLTIRYCTLTALNQVTNFQYS